MSDLSPELAEVFNAAYEKAAAAGFSEPEPEEPEDEPLRTSSGGIPLCIFCRSEIPSTRHAYRKVVGFEKQRRGGGTNAVRVRQPTDEWACSRCVDALADGRDPGQAAFL